MHSTKIFWTLNPDTALIKMNKIIEWNDGFLLGTLVYGLCHRYNGGLTAYHQRMGKTFFHRSKIKNMRAVLCRPCLKWYYKADSGLSPCYFCLILITPKIAMMNSTCASTRPVKRRGERVKQEKALYFIVSFFFPFFLSFLLFFFGGGVVGTRLLRLYVENFTKVWFTAPQILC